MTALHCVAMAQYESIECAQILVDHKCPINERTTDAHETPLFLACNSGYKDIAAYLIQLGVDPNSCSTASRTCFQQAVYKGFKEIVKLLIDNQYRLTSEDRTSCSILIKDLYHDGDVDMLKYLSVDTKTIDKKFLLQSIQEISAVDSLKTKPNSIGDLEAYLHTKLTIDDPK
jgi:ankyrin repeat protein